MYNFCPLSNILRIILITLKIIFNNNIIDVFTIYTSVAVCILVLFILTDGNNFDLKK